MNINLENTKTIAIAKWTIIALAMVLVVFVLIYGIKAIKKLFGIEDTKEVNFDSNEYLEGLAVSDDFNPASYVAELYDLLTESRVFTAHARCTALKRLHEETNDNEFIAVINAYYDTYGETLKSHINDIVINGCSIFSTQWDDQVIDRINKLNLV